MQIHDYRGYSDKQLYAFVYGKISSCDEHASAQYELQRRREHKEFWYRTFVSWAGFAVSLISLLMSGIGLWHVFRR